MVSISAQHIHKKYGETVALHDLTCEIGKGELFGFIGSDGAGKSTLFRILTTLILPDSGFASIEGFDVVKDYKKIRNIMGYMPGKFSLYQDLSVEENLNFFATIFGTSLKVNYPLIKDIYGQIEPFKKRKAGKLSGGMKQKLALSCALIHQPVILFLDEPTTGVDAVSRWEFWEMLRRLKESGITIVVSTPYMDEASLCDRIALLQDGKIMRINSPAQIIDAFPSKLISIKSGDLYQLLKDLKEFSHTRSVHAFGQCVHLSYKDSLTDVSEVESFLVQRNHGNIEIQHIKPSIEDCFMELMVVDKE